MRNIQESILAMLRQHSVRKRITVVLCLVAIATVFTVFWALRISGLTLTGENAADGLEVQTLTDACANEVATGTDGRYAGNTGVTEEADLNAAEETDAESAQAGSNGVTGQTDSNGVTSQADQADSNAVTDQSDSDAGIATLSLDEDEKGISLTSDGSETTGATSSSTVLDATSGTAYYVADAVTLDSVDKTGATNYIIYTVIDENYYVLDASGRLRKANGFSDGLAVSWEADNNVDYYEWNVTQATTEVNGTTVNIEDTYTVCDSAYGQYLSPEYTTYTGTGDDVTITTGFSAHTGEVTLSGDFELTYTFTNKCNGSNSYENYIIEMVTDGVYLDVRADNWGWIYDSDSETTIDPNTADNSSNTIEVGDDSAVVWSSWLETMEAGTSVTVKIIKSGSTVTVTKTAADVTLTATATVSEYENADLTVYLTGENCEISNVSYTCDCEESCTVAGDEEDVTITTGFVTKTSALTLSGDFLFTYTFMNTSTGSSNWENFILEMVGNGVYLDVRADNYGWISGGDEDTDWVEFGDGSADWDAWNKAMADGSEVTVIIERIGGYVTVTTTAAGETFTATAYVSEYAENRSDLTLYLTGEYCNLSGISYTYCSYSYARTSTSAQAVKITLADTASSEYAWTASVDMNFALASGTYVMEAQTATGYIEWLSGADYLQCMYSNAPESGLIFYFAEMRYCKVYFDGTNGGGTVYNEGANNTAVHHIDVVSYEMDQAGTLFYVTVPSLDYETRTSSYYKFELIGWYDIYNTASNGAATSLSEIGEIIKENYYEPGDTMEIAYDADAMEVQTTVCYADYIGTTYDAAIDSATGEAYSAGLLADRSSTAASGNSAGSANGGTADTGGVNTNSFITTHLYDYSDIFNLYSAYLGSGSATTSAGVTTITYKDLSGHQELWELGNVVSGTSLGNSIFGDGLSFGFIFFNNTATANSSLFNLARGTVYGNFNGGNNYKRAANITTTLLSLGIDLRGILFPDNTAEGGYSWHSISAANGEVTNQINKDGILGTTYVGSGNYLYQYDDETGYYYYDAARNAAFYSVSSQRFYLYDYTVRMDNGKGASTSDFLPFNYTAATKSDSDGNEYGEVYYTGINYSFGMNSEISFTLPDDVPYKGENVTDKLNQANERDMKFCFIGDDDMWVYLDEGESDEQLILDIGGIHGEIYGEINFSTGVVAVVDYLSATITVDGDGNVYSNSSSAALDTLTDAEMTEFADYITAAASGVEGIEIFIEETSEGLYQITDFAKAIEGVVTETYIAETAETALASGSHVLSIYYLERGASESNLAIYFNISSETYNLELTKWAEELGSSNTGLDGAVFTYYTSTDFESGNEASLTDEDGNTASSFEAGKVAYGLRVGKTYYIKETTYPEGYTDSGKYMSVYLNRNGVLTINVYNSGGGDPIETYTYTYSASGSTWQDTGTASTDWDYVTYSDSAGSDVCYMNYTVKAGEVTGYYDIGFIVQNTKAYELPATGSIGIFPYRTAGMAFVLVAVTGLLIMAFYHLARVRRLRASGNKEGSTKDGKKCERRFARTRDHPRQRRLLEH